MSPQPRGSPAPLLILYTKPGCHLCQDALAALERLRARYPHRLQQVDITADADLLRRYGERIPVIELSGREYAAPLSLAVLERMLRQAANFNQARPAQPVPDPDGQTALESQLRDAPGPGGGNATADAGG